MGCSVSRQDAIFTKNTVDSSSPATTKPPIPRTLSLPSPLIHHPPLKKGDTHHLVSLTSSTYGSLRLIDQDSTIATDDETNKNNNKTLPLTLTVEETEYQSPHSVINAWELMADLDDSEYSVKSSVAFESPKKSFCPSPHLDRNESMKKFYDLKVEVENSTSGKVKKLCDSFEIESTTIKEEISPSSKPLWKHLSEESFLADMDPNVVSSFRKAQSSRQLGFNQSRTMGSMENGVRVSPLFDNGISLPGTEDKIVLYFTSLRGIRRTYEDCCTVRLIFKGFRVSVDERDTSMDSAYRKELLSVLEEKTVSLPQVFIRGKHIGGADEIKQLHEVGELSKLLLGFPLRDPGFVCEICGDDRFVPCSNCNGSRKIFDEDEEQLRRCQECNENGLIRCPNCCS